jgi:hypothetical protein
MSEESTNPVEGVEAEPQASDETEELLDQTETEGEVVEPEVEEVETEFGGKKYKIPKALEAERLMHADYTRKTQEVAEQRRQIEAQRMQWEEERKAAAEAEDERLELKSVQKAVKQYEALDWPSFHAQDPENAQRQFMAYQMLRNKAQELEGSVSTKQQAAMAREQEQRQRIVQAATDYLRQQIPDWSPTKAAELRATGVETYGFDARELERVVDPRFVRLLHDAALYRKSLAKASAPVEQKPQPQPVRKVGSSAPAAKDPDKMSTEEWMKWRNSQVRKQRSA